MASFARRDRRSRCHRAGALALRALVLALAIGSSLAASSPSAAARARLFAPNSVWNHPLAPNARIDPRSQELIAGLKREVHREVAAKIGPWIQTNSYTTPLYIARSHQRRVRVALQDGRAPGRRSLQRVFNRVPIPSYARPSAGGDGQMTVWQPATDRLWEFWQARKHRRRWHATWGGAMRHVSGSPGYYDRSSWPGRSLLNWGATASSLPVIGGTMLIRELRSLRITHALAMDLPDPRARVYSWPAQRTDGSGPRSSIPEGARLRLPPHLNLRRLHLPRVTLAMARAAKRRGIIVRDRSSVVGFYAQDPGRRKPDPYYGRHGVFARRSPSELLARFPWRKLEVLEMSLCTDQSRPCRRR